VVHGPGRVFAVVGQRGDWDEQVLGERPGVKPVEALEASAEARNTRKPQRPERT